MLIVSKNDHASFRSEEIEYVGQIPSDKSIRFSNTENTELTNKVGIGFKSGTILTVVCKDVNEASEFVKTITEAMNKDYTL